MKDKSIMTNKDRLNILIKESEELINGSFNHLWIRFHEPYYPILKNAPSEGAYSMLSAIFTVLDLYSTIHYCLSKGGEINQTLTEKEETAKKEIDKLIKDSKLSKRYIFKKDFRVNAQDAFVGLIEDLREKNSLKLGISDNKEAVKVWRRARNLIIHLNTAIVGMQTIIISNPEVLKQKVKIPLNNVEDISNFIIEAHKNTDPFDINLKSDSINVMVDLLLAYMHVIKEQMYVYIDTSSAAAREFAFKYILDQVIKQTS